MKMTTITTIVVLCSMMVGCKKQSDSEPAEKKMQPPRVNLHVAALQGNLEAIKQHIEAGSDLNQKDEYGSTALITATTFDQQEVARTLINADVGLTVANNDGSTALHVAAFFCRTKIVQALLDKGADKNVRNNFGSTPLDSVTGPFEDVKGVYDQISAGLKPLGLRLDYDRIKAARPQIAEMLK